MSESSSLLWFLLSDWPDLNFEVSFILLLLVFISVVVQVLEGLLRLSGLAFFPVVVLEAVASEGLRRLRVSEESSGEVVVFGLVAFREDLT